MLMSREFLATIALLFLFLVLILITSYLYKNHNWSSENSRKFIHVAGGILCLTGFRFIHSHWYILILCSIAFSILLVTFIKKSLPAIHKTRMVSFGSVLFPVPVYFCFLASEYWNNDVFFYIPVFLLTIPDTLAEWGGHKWGDHTISFFNKQKTLAGSICFAVSSFIICIFLLFYFISPSTELLVGYSFLLTLTTTVAELLTLKGFDNITVPATALLLLHLFI
jgi:phytol kinase